MLSRMALHAANTHRATSEGAADYNRELTFFSFKKSAKN